MIRKKPVKKAPKEKVKILGQWVTKGTKAYDKLMYEYKHANDLLKHEINGTKKRKINGVHKDNKSHNVKINVLSGTNINVNDYRIDKYIELQNKLLKLKKDKILIQQNLKKLKGQAKKFKKFDLDTTNNDIFLTTSKIKNFKKLYKSL